MSGSELIEALRDDAEKWATAFCQYAAARNTPVDYEWAVTWFADVIEGSDEFRRGPQPSVPSHDD